MADSIKQYDVVRITGITGVGPQGVIGSRAPAVGDTACVVEIFSHMPELGYAMECVAANGETEWVASFAAQDVTLEYVRFALSPSGVR